MSMSVAFNSAPPVQTRPAPHSDQPMTQIEKIRAANKPGAEQDKPARNEPVEGTPPSSQNGRRLDIQV